MSYTSKFRIGCLFAIVLLATQSIAQSSADIYRRLQKLDKTLSVLYVAAHPDDENTRLITWLSQEKLYNTAYVSLTRGDGGQNLIGSELGIDLGLIRTRELMAARAIDGGEQYFTSAYDFGFSKNSDETLRLWDKEKVLSDLVYIIRSFRPDVIICRFPPDQRAGHGHHSSSAILAREAFDAAADPSRFPESIVKGVWQAKRIYWNTFNFGSNNTTSENQLKIDVGNYSPLLGKSYGEIAADSRSQHKSQGFGVPRQRGTITEYFSAVAGDTLVKDLFESIPASWMDRKDGEAVSRLIRNAMGKFDFRNPSLILEDLLAIRKEFLQMKDETMRNRKLKETETLILDCLGFWAAAYAASSHYSPGDTIHLQVQAINRSSIPLLFTLLPCSKGDSLITDSLKRDVLRTYRQVHPGSRKTTQPYWLELPLNGRGNFDISGNPLKTLPWSEPACYANAVLSVSGQEITIKIPVNFKHTDPVKGELYDPLFIEPLITGHCQEDLLIFNSLKEKKLKFRCSYNGQGESKIRIGTVLSNPDEWSCSLKDTVISFNGKGEEAEITIYVRPLKKNAGKTDVGFYFEKNGTRQTISAVHKINYDHIPPVEWYPTLNLKAIYVEYSSGITKIAYLKGAGDEVPRVLRQAGFKVDEMSASEIEDTDLSSYDALVTGIRAYNTDERLPKIWSKVDEFIRNGGTMLVQYNTNSNLHPVKYMAPFPYSISRNRVTEEDAEVSFPLPSHPLLNKPNKISQNDFNGWIQERGLYFASNIDSAYTSILLMNDKGEQPQKGSLIYCKHGKGRYIYTGISFFRQLPAGVPGALRLFVNLMEQEKTAK